MFDRFKPTRADLERTIAVQAREIELTRRDLAHAKASCAQAWLVIETLGQNLPTTVARAVLTMIMGRT